MVGLRRLATVLLEEDQQHVSPGLRDEMAKLAEMKANGMSPRGAPGAGGAYLHHHESTTLSAGLLAEEGLAAEMEAGMAGVADQAALMGAIA